VEEFCPVDLWLMITEQDDNNHFRLNSRESGMLAHEMSVTPVLYKSTIMGYK